MVGWLVGWLADASQTLEYGKNYDGYWTGELFVKQVNKFLRFIKTLSDVHTAEREDYSRIQKSAWPRISGPHNG